MGGTISSKDEMRIYKVTYWRGNPQLRNGGSERTMEIKAKTKASAKKKFREAAERCSYGTMELLEIEEGSAK